MTWTGKILWTLLEENQLILPMRPDEGDASKEDTSPTNYVDMQRMVNTLIGE